MEIETELLTKEALLQDQEIDEAKLCVVCQDAPKTIVLVPCGHICLCEVCERGLPRRHCPICNIRYAQRCKVFM